MKTDVIEISVKYLLIKMNCYPETGVKRWGTEHALHNQMFIISSHDAVTLLFSSDSRVWSV
jgi:hypothetical protein